MIDPNRELSAEICCLQQIINELEKVKGITHEDVKNLDLALSILGELEAIERSPDKSPEVSVAFSIYRGARGIDFAISKDILEIIITDTFDFGMGADSGPCYYFSTESAESPTIEQERVRLLEIIGDFNANGVKNLTIEVS